MFKLRNWLLVLIIINFSSCKLFYPNFILRDNGAVKYLELRESQKEAQLIVPGDRLSFILKARDGFELIDILHAGGGAGAGGMGQGGVAFGYLVRQDGMVELPLLGDLKVVGMARKELEDLLEQKYSSMFNDPFVILQIINRQVYLFTGLNGAQAVALPRDNIKLIELLAMAGGIPPNAKSHKIKIIRGDYANPSIKKIDLSTIEGLKDAGFIVQPNDLIIIDPTTKVAPAILTEITPFLTLITTAFTFYILFKR
ncbi:MAG: polysaccharide biosynthesis/export family protein [Chitinophagales bacterium]|nr:polysaccharide biosynthesis/export family protein [Chitinophagales bacterium]